MAASPSPRLSMASRHMGEAGPVRDTDMSSCPMPPAKTDRTVSEENGDNPVRVEQLAFCKIGDDVKGQESSVPDDEPILAAAQDRGKSGKRCADRGKSKGEPDEPGIESRLQKAVMCRGEHRPRQLPEQRSGRVLAV